LLVVHAFLVGNISQNLKNGLDSERNRRLQVLEDRLMRKKLACKKALADASASDQDQHQLKAELLAEETDITRDRDRINGNFNVLRDGLTRGLKKRAVLELKQAKAAGATKNNGVNNYGNNSSIVNATVAVDRTALEEAAEALKKRHERDQLSLLESLGAERDRQKKILHDKLLARRRALGSHEGRHRIESLERENQAELATLEAEFQRQQQYAVENSKRDLLLSLSALYVDDTVLAQLPIQRRNHGDEIDYDDVDDEDDNGSESARNAAKGLTVWLNRVELTNEAYLAAERQLMKKIEPNFGGVGSLREDDGGSTNEANRDLINQVTVHMSKVLTDAFCKTISDTETAGQDLHIPGVPGAFGRRDKGLSEAQLAAMKASILNEFERSRTGYENALERARDRSRLKLNQRLSQDREMGATNAQCNDFAENHTADGAELQSIMEVQAKLDTVIDSFLGEPIAAAAEGSLKLPGSDNDSDRRSRVSKENNRSTSPGMPLLPLDASFGVKKLPPIAGGSSTNMSAVNMLADEFASDTSSKDDIAAKDRMRTLHREKEQNLVSSGHISILDGQSNLSFLGLYACFITDG
jgi:hypothetical protein